MSKDAYTLTSPDGKSSTLPVRTGTLGPDVIDIGQLYKDQGVFTFDPGYVATGSCKSSITFIDGDKGVLLYRGIPVEQLAQNSNFIEVAYLLQKMEGYSGAVILATNFRHNIDEAFLRRLDHVIDFPFPEPEDRERKEKSEPGPTRQIL